MKEHEDSSAKLEFSEAAQLKGILKYRILRNGVPVEEVEDENLIVTAGRAQMARMLGGDFAGAGRHINRITFGTSGAAPDIANTTIANQFIKNISSIAYPAAGQVCFDWNLSTTEANGKAILEFGLLCVDGTLFSRRIRESGKPINKENDISLEGSWTIIF
jgi:hypothetical protein